MEKETLILSTKLCYLFDPQIIQHLCRNGFRKTGNKFTLQFHGSKGYLSHLSIYCEGHQTENNSLFDIFNKDGTVKKKVINVYHSETNGVRVSLGSDEARIIEQPIEDLSPL